MQNKKVRTAVVGAGKMGTIHAKVYSQLPQSDLVAVVDTDAGRARAWPRRIIVWPLPTTQMSWARSMQ